MTEVWLPLPNGDGRYEISSIGRVRRATASNSYRAGRICKPAYLRGYARYRLSFGDKCRMFNAHRSAYEAFVGPIPEGMQINHKNGIKDDNRVENLEVMTASENTAHAYRVLGLPGRKYPQPGEENGRAKLTWELAKTIRSEFAQGKWSSQQACADAYGLNQTNISRLLRGDTWKTPA